MTVAWISKMKPVEINQVYMERGCPIGDFEPTFTEIYFQSTTHSKSVVDEFGDVVNLEYRYVTPMRSDYGARIAKKLKPLEDEVLKVVERLEWPSKNEIHLRSFILNSK